MLVLIAGAIFFPASYFMITKALHHVFGNRLTKEDILLVTEKCVSSLQALLSIGCGVVIVSHCQNNIMTDTHWLSNTYAKFAVPYFIYDFWAMFRVFEEKNRTSLYDLSTLEKMKKYARSDIAMVAHHVGLAFIFYPVALTCRNGKGDFFMGLFFLCEMAIPFISIRFIMAQLKMKHSTLYVVAGLQMIFAFFISRICIFPYMYSKYAVYAGISVWEVPGSIPIKCNVGILSLIVLQLYWMVLMIRGAISAFIKVYTGNVKGNRDD